MENVILDLFQKIGAQEVKEEEMPRYKKLIGELVAFSEKARKEGILALEGSANKVEDRFLREGLFLIVDGNDWSMVEDILYTQIIADNYRNFLERIIMLQAVKCICDGENPRIVERRLWAFINSYPPGRG